MVTEKVDEVADDQDGPDSAEPSEQEIVMAEVSRSDKKSSATDEEDDQVG